MKRYKKHNQTRQKFLLSFFKDKNNFYAEMNINGFVLVKHSVGGKEIPEIAIYTQEAFKLYKKYNDTRTKKVA